MIRRIWSEDEVNALIALMNEGATFAVAGEKIGRGMEATKKKWAAMNAERMDLLDIERPVIVPKERLVERRRRLDAPHRTLVGACLGDPAIGYSALDKRADASARARKVTVYELVTDAPPLQPLAPDEPAGGRDPRGYNGEES
jgi:hypothetical protein